MDSPVNLLPTFLRALFRKLGFQQMLTTRLVISEKPGFPILTPHKTRIKPVKTPYKVSALLVKDSEEEDAPAAAGREGREGCAAHA